MRTWLTIFLLGFLILAFGWGLRRVPSITVENRGDVALERAVLVVGGDAGVRADLAPGLGEGQSIPLRAEGGARLELRFADGTERRVDAGWFSPAARHDLRVVVVSPDSIRVEPAR